MFGKSRQQLTFLILKLMLQSWMLCGLCHALVPDRQDCLIECAARFCSPGAAPN
jgi:hypothetical protein